VARGSVPDQRFDFSGGVNRSRTQDSLDATELRYARNMRRWESGGYRKRPGSKRIHTDALGAPTRIIGGHQWQNPSAAEEIVVISNTDLYYKSLAATTFTLVAGGLSTTVPPRFCAHREGATIKLYIAEGSLSYWDGTTLDESITGAPSAIDLGIYKGRLFAVDGTKALHWTQINEPENWDGGASADVETFDTEGCVALAPVGSSLAIGKRNSWSRFTGVSNQTIRIDRESEGINQNIGVLARHTVIPVENWFFFVHDRGPYLGDEAGVYFIGQGIENYLAANVDYSNLENAVATYDQGTRKILLMYPTGSSSTQNAEGWLFDMETRTWEGPIDFQGFNASCLIQHVRTDKTKGFLVGGYDGFVRDGWPTTALWKDDVVNAGTGGTAIPAKVTLPDIIGGNPGLQKSLRAWQNVSCDLDDDGELYIDWTNEDGETGTIGPITSQGAGVNDYPWKSKGKGTRLTLSFREETANDFKFNGVSQNLHAGSAK
jgi:hypothetical protein